MHLDLGDVCNRNRSFPVYTQAIYEIPWVTEHSPPCQLTRLVLIFTYDESGTVFPFFSIPGDDVGPVAEWFCSFGWGTSTVE